MEKQKINVFGFTLVELIIVVTILAILSSIAFISFQSYSKSSRDSFRLATLKNIDTGLNLLAVDSGNFPIPDDIYGTGVVNANILSYVGYIGESNSRLLKFSKIPEDPAYETKYTYGVSYDYKSYQIASVMEGNETSFLIDKTYAGSNTTKVIGNYLGIISYNDNGKVVTNMPSLIFSSTGTIDIGSTEPYFIVNNGGNLPDSFKEKFQVKNDIKSVALSKIGSSATDIYVESIGNVTKDNWEDYKSALKTKFGLSEQIIGETVFGKEVYNSQVKKEDVVYPSCILGDGTSTGSIFGECSL